MVRSAVYNELLNIFILTMETALPCVPPRNEPRNSLRVATPGEHSVMNRAWER